MMSTFSIDGLLHYSIQLEIYRYLMGAVGRKTKRLMVVTPGYELVHTIPMKIWATDGVLQKI
jgi:hypothetical protein